MSQQKPTEVEADIYARNYVEHGDQTRAFRATFPNSKAKQESLHQKASAFHKIVEVQSRIVEVRELMREVAEKEFNLTTMDVVKGLYTEATTNGEGSTASARVSAWKALGEYTGGFDANKQRLEHSGSIDLTGKSDAELQAIIDEFG